MKDILRHFDGINLIVWVGISFVSNIFITHERFLNYDLMNWINFNIFGISRTHSITFGKPIEILHTNLLTKKANLNGVKQIYLISFKYELHYLVKKINLHSIFDFLSKF